MAPTITWDTLRELAGFSADQGCAVSLYLNLDPSEVPTAAGVETRANSLISEAHRTLEERKGSMTPRGPRGAEARHRADQGLVRRRLRPARPPRRCGLRGRPRQPLEHAAAPRSGRRPPHDRRRALPRAARAARGPQRTAARRGGRTRARTALQAPERRARRDRGRDRGPAGTDDPGSESQARFERYIDEVVERHWRRVAETLHSCVRILQGARVVLVGAEDMRSDFEQLLSHETKNRVLGWTTAEAHADAAQLLDAVRPVSCSGGRRATRT